MTQHFNYTLEAVKSGDRHQWKIGEALRKDLPDHTVETVTEGDFEPCVSKLNKLGFTAYSSNYLRRIFVTAWMFKGDDRTHHPWIIHRVAGTPVGWRMVLVGRVSKSSIT